MIRFALLLSLCALAATAAADTNLRPGGIARIDLERTGAEEPVVEFNGKRVLVMQVDGRWQAVVGIPLDTPVGENSVTLAGGETMAFEVADHAYKEQRLTVSQSYVTPNNDALERITAERKILDAALGNWREENLQSIDLAAPVEGPRSSSFGLRRFFNDQPRSPHKGMDIAASAGTAITAPKSGIVTVSGDFYFNGSTVLLDHGQGYVTMYCHMSAIDVVEGQAVAAGDRLGAVGATGRVTGAHLHFGTYMNGTAVDPAIVLSSD